MKRGPEQQEAQTLAYLQMRKLQTVRAGDLIRPLWLTRLQERELFRRLARGGLIARVRPGLFVVPPQLPLKVAPDLRAERLQPLRSTSRCRPASTSTTTASP